MFHRLFLIVALLTTCTVLGVSSLHAPSEKVQAFAGDPAILPCSFNISAGDDFPTVEWSKRGLKPENIVYLQRDGFEIHAMKNPAFEYRTSLIQRELQNGNISLRISSVQLSDAGFYQCMRLWSKARRDITTVELVVGAVSEPKLSVISAESGGVTVQCVAECWLPLPEIQFLDDHGNDITAKEQRSDRGARGCYTVERRVTLQGPTKRITCRVHQSEVNQTKEIDILIPGGKSGARRSCFPTARVAVPGAAVLLFCVVVVVFFSCKKCGKSARIQKMPLDRQPSDQSTASSTSENQPILGSVVAQNEKLRKEVVELRSKVLERERTILQLQNGTESKLSPVVSQLDQPTMVRRPSKPPKAPNIPKEQRRKPPAISRQNSLESAKRPSQRSRVHSCPDVLDFTTEISGSSSARSSKKKLFGRSVSDACAQSGQSVPKDQRRRSPVFPSSTPMNNPFSPLEGLSEESEQLISFNSPKLNAKQSNIRS